jgi:hypothetical protein
MNPEGLPHPFAGFEKGEHRALIPHVGALSFAKMMRGRLVPIARRLSNGTLIENAVVGRSVSGLSGNRYW